MSQTTESSEMDFEVHVERLAAKTTFAAELLERTTQVAEQLQKLEVSVNRYVRQARLIITWKRSSGVFTMVGSAAKTAGSVMVLAAPLHPKLTVAVKAGHKLWKLGAGLKVLSSIGGMLRELWHNGCRNTLLEFTKCAAMLTRNVGVFQELICDLQSTTEQLNASNNNNFQAPEEIIQVLSEFIPPQHIGYAAHVMNIVFGNQGYSPLFDFISLSSDPTNKSDLVQVVREMEGFRFTEFAEQSDSKSLVAIGGFLHISRELLDFLDGFQKVSDKDCRFLEDCLTKFSEESVSILKVVSLLTGLSKLKDKLQSPSSQLSVEEGTVGASGPTPDSGEEISLENDCDLKAAMETEVAGRMEIGDEVSSDRSGETNNGEVLADSTDTGQEDCKKVATTATASDHSQSGFLARTVRRAEIVANSKDFMLKTISTMSLVMEKGTSIISSSLKMRKRSHADSETSKCDQSNEAANQI